MQEQEEHHQSRHGYRDFWHEWREGEDHPVHTHQHDPDCSHRHKYVRAPSTEETEAWREFFHKKMGVWPEDHWVFGGRRFSPWHDGMYSFNPFVASLFSKGGGLLPLYVLDLVVQKPRYGNEIMDLLAERTGGQWMSNPGAIYPLLTLLEERGLIEGAWEDPQKRTVRIYSVTKTGEEELIKIKAIISPKISETIQVLQELVQDLEGIANEPQASENKPEK
jgi:PadR family transcriptional regulator, regulatory protein PadR